jgi:signal transduction histidine kinase
LDETGRDYVDRMQGASERMLELLADLLRYARVTSQAKAFEATDLGAVATMVVSDLGEQIRRENGTVEVGSLPLIDADPVQIRQMVQNLVSNALKFHHPDRPPVVKIAAELRDDDRVALTVADNGIGFKAKFAERIFQPFRRLHGKGQYEGTGMGLAIVKKIAERHGGEVDVQSEPDLGSRFTITLPRQRQSEEFGPALAVSKDKVGKEHAG